MLALVSAQQITAFAGILGAALYVLSYMLLQMGRIKGESLSYALLKLLGAVLVTLSLIHAFNLASLIIQISMATLSILGITRRWFLSKSIRLSQDESAFGALMFPNVCTDRFAKLVRAGHWVTMPKDSEITTQGHVNQNLFFLAEGQCDVRVNGQIIANLPAKSFVGEMTLETTAPATATVIPSETALVWQINRAVLDTATQRDPSLKRALDYCLFQDMGRKLAAKNKTSPA